MSSIEEKLKHFNDLILKDAIAERDKILEQIKREMNNTLNKKRAEIQKEADEFLRKEIAVLEREKNNRIYRATVEGKQLLMKAREDILRILLEEVKAKLIEFIKSEDYYAYLIRQIKESCAQAGSGRLTVYISKTDAERFSPRLDEIKNQLPAGATIVEIDEEIMGGCRVFNEDESIIVDNTLAKRLELVKDNVFEICKFETF